MTAAARPETLPKPEPLPHAYTVNEIALKYRCNRSTVCVAIQQGKLKAGRVGRRYLVLPSAVVEWLSREKP